MTGTKNKYANAKIYKVEFPDGKVYIGSTVASISGRFSRHKTHYKMYKAGNFHNVSIFDYFELFGVDSCKLSLVESFPCDNIKDLQLREGYYIKNDDNVINHNVAGRTRKEWYQQQGKKRTECPCSGSYDINHKKQHRRTERHLNYMAS